MSESTSPAARPRLLSLDAYRGFTMLAMASGGLGIAKLVSEDPASNMLWDKIAYQLDHCDWRGCSFWDTIQPSFMFIVGVAMPFSYASRRALGQSWSRMFGHAVFRSILLIALGVFLASQGSKQTNFVFTNVLAQIGLGYTFVFLLLGRPPAFQLAAAVFILVVDWVLFAIHPRPGLDFYWVDVGIYPNWQRLTGFAQHWEKNVNFAAHFDRWFLNLFPRPAGEPYKYNDGGYTTLNFFPSIATMIFGVLTGEWLRMPHPAAKKVGPMIIAGAAAVVFSSALDPDVCPIVKRIWTPSWTVYSAGWALLELVLFYWLIDVKGIRRWTFPLVVVGMNSIAMYMMAQLSKGWVSSTLKTHLGQQMFAGKYGPIYQSLAVLFVFWLVCYWMYRRRIFIRI